MRIEASAWDCALEPAGAAGLALLLGLRLVKGLAQDVVRRLVDAQARPLFRDLDDAVRRAALDRHARDAPVAADAFAKLAGDRHQARWQALAVHDARPRGRPHQRRKRSRACPWSPRARRWWRITRALG
ncbi:helix-hairpin-helix protein [Plasticicumulans lactativorans]|uniref:Helix-hairpin-helix protein n=1 Tax=Plasticicumulans lactativorans TaxID=1133106 RepID=A0A4R2LE91_9GAMM|nr:hypothetical protein [Plasticicumulans lactativorans]TCO82976.1 helix-hairpin-helix protein [Plasticicumulans lactativorans]